MEMQTFLSEIALRSHVEKVRSLAAGVRSARLQPPARLPLREMGAWTTLRAAQAWIAARPPPCRAWEGERVRRVALEIGYRRPVMEGAHVGFDRPVMCVDMVTSDVAVFPEELEGRSLPFVAGGLIHEATHIVHAQVYGERFGLSSEEVFVLSMLNDEERARSVFATEGLAHWNQAAWLLGHASLDLERRIQGSVVVEAARAVRREAALDEFAPHLVGYTTAVLRGRPDSGVRLPLVWMSGRCAGAPMVPSDLAPSILEPLFQAAGAS